MSFNSWTSIHFSLFVGFRFFSLYFVFLLYRFRRFFPLEFVFLLYRFRFISLDFVFLLYRFRWILFSFRFVSFLSLPVPSCMSVRYSTPHVHYPQLNSSRVCLPTNFQKFKCQYLWSIKFLEWAYRKKWGDMRGYFHRLGYWGFIFRLILLRFSFVFFIRKSYRMVLSFRFWALFDYWIFPTCHV